jgi:hypothetical protein
VILDARFEVLGGSFSLLSANISASQHLYTRKGSLVGFNGKPDNVRIGRRDHTIDVYHTGKGS